MYTEQSDGQALGYCSLYLIFPTNVLSHIYRSHFTGEKKITSWGLESLVLYFSHVMFSHFSIKFRRCILIHDLVDVTQVILHYCLS